jgi:hypothetical protein
MTKHCAMEKYGFRVKRKGEVFPAHAIKAYGEVEV